MTFDDTPPANNDFFVSSERHLLDTTWVTNAILGSYWGGWRTHELIVESIRNSLCFGLYRTALRKETLGLDCIQIGFLRVITDYATFSEICDVIVDEKHRKQGLGKFLVFTATHDPRICKTVMHLGTRDAHAFYAALGFQPVSRMRKIPK